MTSGSSRTVPVPPSEPRTAESKRSFMSGLDLRLPILLIVLVVLFSLPFPIYARQWHRLLHIVGAVLLIGNLVVTAVWMVLTVRTGQRAIAHFGAKAVIYADLYFTIPGVILLLINGLVLAPAHGAGNVLGASWVVAGLALLIASGVIWAGFLVRYQNRLVQLSASGDKLSADFMRVFMMWGIWGGVATVLPILSLLLMVFKPTLWGQS
jgi:uncharacterized membrane protein